MTAVYLRVTSEGLLTVCHAGHLPLLILSSDGSKAVLLKTPGTALGLFKEEQVPLSEVTFQLQEGDKIFIYTDGVFERQNSNRDEFGMERLVAFLEEHRSAPTDVVTTRLLQEVEDFAEGCESHDDVTIIGIEYKGNQAQ